MDYFYLIINTYKWEHYEPFLLCWNIQRKSSMAVAVSFHLQPQIKLPETFSSHFFISRASKMSLLQTFPKSVQYLFTEWISICLCHWQYRQSVLSLVQDQLGIKVDGENAFFPQADKQRLVEPCACHHRHSHTQLTHLSLRSSSCWRRL